MRVVESCRLWGASVNKSLLQILKICETIESSTVAGRQINASLVCVFPTKPHRNVNLPRGSAQSQLAFLRFQTVLHTIESANLGGVEEQSNGSAMRKVQFLQSVGWRESCGPGHSGKPLAGRNPIYRGDAESFLPIMGLGGVSVKLLK